ncbi:MAG TPA: hypothetical protein VF865_22130 [Acidobacteriaceae bacterium]
MNAATDLALAPILAAEQEYAPPSVHAPHMTPPEAARRYCIFLLILPLLAIPAFIRLGCSDFFMRHGASVWVQSNDAVFGMRDRDCDVLVFGDSTAMTGIDPDVVERNTGFKTCNIAVTNAVLAVTHNLTLNRYLANNARPRVLLVQLSPDGFEPESNVWHQTVYPEGLLELLRHGSPAERRRVLLTHPQEAIAFAGYAAGFTLYSGVKEIWYHATNLRPVEDAVTIHNGFFTPPSAPRTSCEPGATFSNPRAGGDYPRSVVGKFENDYAGRSGIVLVNVAPIPSCDQNLAAFSSELNGVTSNSLLPLPIGLFNDPRHYTAVGSAVVSRLVAQELNAVAQHNPQIDDRTPAQLPRTVASLQLTGLSR